MQAVELLVWGVVIHLVADWLLQNHWMAANKCRLTHPAAWVHSGIHTAGALLVFPPPGALLIGLLHLLIDTRIPLTWWLRFYRQTQEGTLGLIVALMGDQVAHVAVIAAVAWMVTR